MNHTYAGALHIHSTYSDGTGSIESIAIAAKKAGLSWIVVTDHDNLSGLSKEGWYDGVAVLVGQEISPGDSNHYLALNITQAIKDELNPLSFINQVKRQAGIGFIAHPDESLFRKNTYKPLRWQDWSIQGFDGIEIWNHLSDWVDNYDPKNPVHCFFNRNKILTGPTSNVLNWWDTLNNSSTDIVPAIGGLDVHAMKYNFLGMNFQVFPYYDSFKSVINCLHLDKEISKDFKEAKQQIYSALKQGKSTIVNRVWNIKSGQFSFLIENQTASAFPGSSINYDQGIKAVIQVPRKAKIRLIRNGQLVDELNGKKLVYTEIQEGKYRVEVYYKDCPWIFSNPILVK